MLQHLCKISETWKINREDGVYCIIFVPIRELCIQVEMTLKKLLYWLPFLVGGSLMGGESIKKEKSRLWKGINVLICTPGWLLYHLKNTESFKFNYLQYFIFDEADWMLDLGFEREMSECLNYIKGKNRTLYVHQANFETKDYVKTVLVSATLTHWIEHLAS